MDHAEWNHIVRGETELQSVDRHFNELLQELQVTQTGVQILFALLLGLAFTPRFPELTGGQQGTYQGHPGAVGGLGGAADHPGRLPPHRLPAMAPAQLATPGHRYAIAGLVLLLLALVGAVQLAASFVLGPRATILVAALAGRFATLCSSFP